MLEVVGILDGGGESSRGDHADAGDRHEDAAGLALAGIRDELAPEFGGTEAHAAPSFQHRQHDRDKPVLIHEKIADILLEAASFAGRDEKPERFHEAADLV